MVESILKFTYLFLPCKTRYNVKKYFLKAGFTNVKGLGNWETTPILFEGYRRSNLHFVRKIQQIKVLFI